MVVSECGGVRVAVMVCRCECMRVSECGGV